MENKERSVQFVTMASDGKKPDVEIHCAGFVKEDEKGIGIVTNIQGGGRYIAQAIANLAGEFAKNLLQKDSTLAAAAFLNGVTDSISKNIGKDAMMIAMVMADPKGGEALENILKSVISDEDGSDEEEGDE